MKTLKLLLLSVLLSSASALYAQDLMYLRGQKSPIKVKVTEVGLDEIKYKYWPVNDEAPVQVIAKDNVAKVVLQTGDTYTFKEAGMNAVGNYDNQKKNAFKIAFLSPLFGNTTIYYERSIKPGRSYELGLGVIGLGSQSVNVEKKCYGVFGRLGYKFISPPDFYLRGMRYAHILKGFYAKPEVVLGYYSVDFSTYGGFYSPRYTLSRDVVFGGVLMNIGKQWVFDDAFLLDMYFGLGYGFASYDEGAGNYYNERNPELYHYAFWGGYSQFPIALSAGLKIGFLTGKHKVSTPETPPVK